jgi:galactose mutarotase-like enzyme
MIPTGDTQPVTIEPGKLGERTFDDAYTGLGDEPRFVLSGGGRRIVVTFLDGYPYAQVYAPENQALICFEPMTAPANALRSGEGLMLLGPGDTYSAVFTVTSAGA